MKAFLALYMGFDTPMDPSSISDETKDKGMAAWGQWMADHADAVIDSGGPVGKTKKTAAGGVSDTRRSWSACRYPGRGRGLGARP